MNAREKGVEGSSRPFDVHQALHLLPSVLDADTLPNGVVELVIEDSHAPARCLLDIHDGRVSHVEPGTMVPWASIAGSRSAWVTALHAGNANELRLTGEERLGQRVLAALPHAAIGMAAVEQSAPV
jgi:hypothetical protein